MKFLITTKKEYNSLKGRSVQCFLGHVRPKIAATYRDSKGYFFTCEGGEYLADTEAKLDEVLARLNDTSNDEKLEVEVSLKETSEELAGTSFGLDYRSNQFATLDLSKLDQAFDSIKGAYDIKLYRDAFYRVYESGRFSIREMMEKGWLVD